MSDLDDAIASLNESADRANNTTDFFDSVTTGGETVTVTNPNNNKTVPSVQKQVKDLYDADFSTINDEVEAFAESAEDAKYAAEISASAASVSANAAESSANSIAESEEKIQNYSDGLTPSGGIIDFNGDSVDVAVLGASIMDGIFSDSVINVPAFISKCSAGGLEVDNVYDYAVAGTRASHTLTVSATLISDLGANSGRTIVLIHTGGNNVTQDGPYPGGIDDLLDDYRQIINNLQDAGFIVVPCSLSYRTPPASNPTYPYNELALLPMFKEICPTAVNCDGRFTIDFHKFTLIYNKDNQTDGVHYNDDGYLLNAEFLGESLASVCQTGVKVPVTNVIVNMRPLSEDGIAVIYPDENGEGYLNDATQSDGSVAIIEMSMTGFASAVNSTGNASYTGTGYSLSNPVVTTRSMFVCDPNFSDYAGGSYGQISFNGNSIEDDETYTVSIVASRNTNPLTDTKRIGVYTVGGNSQQIDASDLGNTSPNIGVFTGVLGSELKSTGIKIERLILDDTGSFAYVNGIQIVKE